MDVGGSVAQHSPLVFHTGVTFDLNQPPHEQRDQPPEIQQLGDSQPCHSQSEDEEPPVPRRTDGREGVLGSPGQRPTWRYWSQGVHMLVPIQRALHARVAEKGTSRTTFSAVTQVHLPRPQACSTGHDLRAAICETHMTF
ncbi:uncharacterized protein G2W53_037294 [Senna tora]|uniref:Uncharacterized protein n=1 Tax=Senna tora TaxID=362788 RepID=A0A834SVJ2_9FABA|nr:uncharacterized protein G2W53_037294 [Senna tora]